MGDLGVRNSGGNRPRVTSSDVDSAKSKALALFQEGGIAQKAVRGAVAVDQLFDKVPVIGFVTPEKPTASERVTSGVMAVVYSAGAGVSIIPFVGPWTASALIAGGGAAARFMSPNPEVQNQGNLALQTSAYAAIGGCLPIPFAGSVPYARAAIKSALIAMNKG